MARLARARALSESRSPERATPMIGQVEVLVPDQVGQGREDLLEGEVAGGAEEDERVRTGPSDTDALARLEVAAEAEAHRRQDLVGEVGLAAGGEAASTGPWSGRAPAR